MLHHKLNLVAYIRCGGINMNEAQQKAMIEEYCATHGHHVGKVFLADRSIPTLALHDALETLDTADGLIAVDLNRFVKHPDDRLYDLRILVNELIHHGKVLIAINDGIETVTAAGQKDAIEFVNRWSDRDGVVARPLLH